MRSLFYLSSAIAVMGLIFWAYRENYRTQGELSETRALRGEIAQLSESLSVLRAEWAYLNRPDRLRELADINFPRLGLLPLQPAQFGDVAHVAYPPPELPPITEPTDVVASNTAALPAAEPTGDTTAEPAAVPVAAVAAEAPKKAAKAASEEAEDNAMADAVAAALAEAMSDDQTGADTP